MYETQVIKQSSVLDCICTIVPFFFLSSYMMHCKILNFPRRYCHSACETVDVME